VKTSSTKEKDEATPEAPPTQTLPNRSVRGDFATVPIAIEGGKLSLLLTWQPRGNHAVAFALHALARLAVLACSRMPVSELLPGSLGAQVRPHATAYSRTPMGAASIGGRWFAKDAGEGRRYRGDGMRVEMCPLTQDPAAHARYNHSRARGWQMAHTPLF
jgi:hypothetical protein